MHTLTPALLALTPTPSLHRLQLQEEGGLNELRGELPWTHIRERVGQCHLQLEWHEQQQQQQLHIRRVWHGVTCAAGGITAAPKIRLCVSQIHRYLFRCFLLNLPAAAFLDNCVCSRLLIIPDIKPPNGCRVTHVHQSCKWRLG